MKNKNQHQNTCQHATRRIKRAIRSLACAALLIPVVSEAATLTYDFTVPTMGTLPAGALGSFSLQQFDTNLGTLTMIQTYVELTSIGGRARFDSHSSLEGTVTLTVGTALTSLDFPGTGLDLSTIASESSGVLSLAADEAPAGIPDPNGSPDFTGPDAATFSPASFIINSASNDTSDSAFFAPFQSAGGGTFTVDYTSSGEIGALADVDGLADFDQAQWSAIGYVRYTYDAIPEPSSALLLLGAAGLSLFTTRRRRA